MKEGGVSGRTRTRTENTRGRRVKEKTSCNPYRRASHVNMRGRITLTPGPITPLSNVEYTTRTVMPNAMTSLTSAPLHGTPPAVNTTHPATTVVTNMAPPVSPPNAI